MGGLSHTVSGDIASFRTPSRVPIESLKFHFLPKQEGSGDPSPTNIRPITGWTGLNGKRAGKNLIDINSDLTLTGAEKVNNTFVNTITDTRDEVQLYFIGYKKVGNNFTLLGNFKIISGITSAKHVVVNFTVGSAFEEMTHFCIKHNGKTHDFRVYFPLKLPVGATLCCSLDVLSVDVTTIGGFSMGNMQLEVGSVEGTYESYSGAQIPITFPINGKNRYHYDENNIEEGLTTTTGYTRAVYHTGVFGDGRKVSISGSIIEAGVVSNTSLNVGYLKDGIITIKNAFINYADGSITSRSFVVPSGYEFVIVTTDISGYALKRNLPRYNIQIEYADSPTTYEPYSSDNTFYGGYIDPIAGEIVAEYISKICDGTETGWSTSGSQTSVKRWHSSPTGLGLPPPINSSTSQAKFSYFKSSTSVAEWNAFIGSTGNILFYAPLSIDTREKWTTYLSEHNLQICYKLAEPIHIPIAPQDLQAFLDHNNFWSDANDITEVTYAVTESKDILKARKLIMAGSQPHIETVSGLVASFDTYVKAPVKGLKAYFTPTQEGSGDASPSNVRPITGTTKMNIEQTGKNLIDLTQLVSNSVWWNDKRSTGWQNCCTTPLIPVKPGATYYLKRNSNSQDYVSLFDRNGKYVDKIIWATGGAYKTMPDNVCYVGITIGTAYLDNPTPQLELGSTATAYEEFVAGSEIPIEFPATRNLLDTSTHETSTHITKSGITFDYNSDGTLTVNGQVDSGATTGPQYRMALWMQQETGDYYLCCGAPYSAVYNEAYVYDTELSERPKKWDGVTQSQSAASNRPLSEVHLIAGHTYSINIRINRGQDKAYANDEFYVMLLRSTDTDIHYEPYGTIYGGYIDLVRGKIVNTYKKVRLDSFASSWYEESGPSGFFVLQYKIVFADRDKFVCNAYKSVSLPYWNSMPDLSIMGHPTMDNLLRIKDTSYAGDTAGFVANLTNINAELAYPVSTPIEYDITPQILKTLKRTNNIWADTNGDIEVSYWTH